MATFTGKFTSLNQSWETPQWLFNLLDSEFHFEWDLAASSANSKCQSYYSADDDALRHEWRGRCWLNPPYGEGTGSLATWVRKAYAEWVGSADCRVIVMLIPARTNTRWFHDCCMRATELRFLKGRPKFGNAKHGLPQPLVVVVFSTNPFEGTKISSLEVPTGTVH